MKDERRFEPSVRALAAEARQTLGPHLDPGKLLDYQVGEGTAAERERVQEHLSLCPLCTRTLLDLEAFPNLEPLHPQDRLSDSQLTGEWRRFQRRTRAAWTPTTLGVIHPAFRSLPWALAASLLLAVVGLSVWTGRLRHEVGELSAPRADVQVADLTPLEETGERSVAGEELVRIPSWVDRVLLILNLSAVQSYPEYRVEIAPLGGGTAWSRRGVHPGPDGNFTLEAPRRFLADGDYHIRLSGLRGNTWVAVAEYEVRIQGE